MKIYLAASFSRQSEMREVAGQLRAYGIEVTSRWLNENQSISDRPRWRFMRECAYTDVNDVKACDVFVRFSDDLHFPLVYSHLCTGARHFETGLAFALGKPVLIVGGRQNVFDFIDGFKHFATTEELIQYLIPEEIQ